MGLKSSKPCVDLGEVVQQIALKYQVEGIDDLDADTSMMKLINKFAFKRQMIEKEELDKIIDGYKSYLTKTKNPTFDSKEVHKAIELYKKFCAAYSA